MNTNIDEERRTENEKFQTAFIMILQKSEV